MNDGDDPLARLRSQVRPESFEAIVLAELAVLRASLSRLVTAISGDPAVGVDGIIVRLKRHDTRISDLEGRVVLVDGEVRTDRTARKTILKACGLVGGFTGWAIVIWQFFH